MWNLKPYLMLCYIKIHLSFLYFEWIFMNGRFYTILNQSFEEYWFTNVKFPTIHFIMQDQKITFITTTKLIRKIFLSISMPLGLGLQWRRLPPNSYFHLNFPVSSLTTNMVSGFPWNDRLPSLIFEKISAKSPHLKNHTWSIFF